MDEGQSLLSEERELLERKDEEFLGCVRCQGMHWYGPLLVGFRSEFSQAVLIVVITSRCFSNFSRQVLFRFLVLELCNATMFQELETKRNLSPFHRFPKIPTTKMTSNYRWS